MLLHAEHRSGLDLIGDHQCVIHTTRPRFSSVVMEADSAARVGGTDPSVLAGASAATPSTSCLSSSSWIYTADELYSHSPSVRDGITVAQQESRRQSAADYIIDSAKRTFPKSKLDISSTALQMFHRVYARRSMEQHDIYDIASACLHLSGKVVEVVRPLEKGVFELLRVTSGDASVSRESEAFVKAEERLLRSERVILDATEYDFDYSLPFQELKAILADLGISALAEAGRSNSSLSADALLAIDVSNEVYRRVSHTLRFPVMLQFETKAILHTAVLDSLQHAKLTIPRETCDRVITTSVAEMNAIQRQMQAAYSLVGGGSADKPAP